MFFPKASLQLKLTMAFVCLILALFLNIVGIFTIQL